MKRKNIRKIIAWLDAGAPEGHGIAKFDMRSFFRSAACGTACCIAGAAIQFDREERGLPPYTLRTYCTRDEPHASFVASAYLGLQQEVAESLFYGRDSKGGHSVVLAAITPAWAARCLRKLLRTGKVDWTGTRTDRYGNP